MLIGIVSLAVFSNHIPFPPSAMREKMKEYTMRHFNVPFHTTFMKNISVPIYGAHLFDAIMIYARAATEILAENGSLANGVAVMERIFNRTYSSIQGFDVSTY